MKHALSKFDCVFAEDSTSRANALNTVRITPMMSYNSASSMSASVCFFALVWILFSTWSEVMPLLHPAFSIPRLWIRISRLQRRNPET